MSDLATHFLVEGCVDLLCDCRHFLKGGLKIESESESEISEGWSAMQPILQVISLLLIIGTYSLLFPR